MMHYSNMPVIKDTIMLGNVINLTGHELAGRGDNALDLIQQCTSTNFNSCKNEENVSVIQSWL